MAQSSPNNARIAIIGNGKTGHAVVNCLPDDAIYDVYDSNNPVTGSALSKADAAIVFVNHVVLNAILPELIQARIPIICGTTGFHWTNQLIQQINQTNTTWVQANNFSLSMHLIRHCLQILGQAQQLHLQVSFNIHETHHTSKIDAPSGTAKSWQEWLNVSDVSVTYDRLEDVAGIHTLTINTDNEIITLSHQALNRNLFAEGAIYATRTVLSNTLPKGLIHFSQLIELNLNQPQTQEEYQHA